MKHRVVHTLVNSNLNVPLGQTVTPLSATVLTTDYVSNLVYEDGDLKYILNPEGYAVRRSTGDYSYNYYLKDHLGNNRVVLEIDRVNSLVNQATDYYPFGMPYADSQYPERQPYKFGGKEYDEMHGLNRYDFHARHLSTAIPIFTTPDPLAEKYYSVSPYAYCGNNPVRFVDPDGRDIVLYNVTHRNNNGHPDGTRGQVSSKTNAALTDLMKTAEGRNFFGQFAKAGDVVGGYIFKENGKYSSTNLTLFDYSWEKETGNVIPSTKNGSIAIYEDKITLKISSYGRDKNGIGETLTHETQIHGASAEDKIEGKKVPSEEQDHKALKDKNTKHEGYNNYNSVRQQLESIDENYKQAFEAAAREAQRIY